MYAILSSPVYPFGTITVSRGLMFSELAVACQLQAVSNTIDEVMINRAVLFIMKIDLKLFVFSKAQLQAHKVRHFL